MVDPDIVLEKVSNVRHHIRRIEDATDLDPARLEDQDVQDIYVLNLQRAVQSAIDLAAHVVADDNLGIPSSLKETFSLLEDQGVLDHVLAGEMMAMVGFRNIAVHEYQELELRILQSFLTDHLDDLHAFCRAILTYAGLEDRLS